MLAEVDRRILTPKNLHCLNDVWSFVKPAWKHGDVTEVNPVFDEDTLCVSSSTFRLECAMHSLEIDKALARRKMRALNQKWFAHLLMLRDELPRHTFLTGLNCLFPDGRGLPRILFTETFDHPAITSKFAVNLRRFDYKWPLGTLVPATPVIPEAT